MQPARTSQWSASADAYEIKVRLPDLETESVSASLAPDGSKVEVVAKKKIDHCTCDPSIVKEIALPYRPRPEDVDVAMHRDGLLSVRLTRHAKVDAATPLKVNVGEAEDKDEENQETRPLSFVPHASATEKATEKATENGTSGSVAEQEKTLTDKFRGAALASVAVQRAPSGKEAAATTPPEDVDARVAAGGAAAPSAGSAEGQGAE